MYVGTVNLTTVFITSQFHYSKAEVLQNIPVNCVLFGTCGSRLYYSPLLVLKLLEPHSRCKLDTSESKSPSTPFRRKGVFCITESIHNHFQKFVIQNFTNKTKRWIFWMRKDIFYNPTKPKSCGFECFLQKGIALYSS